MLTSPRAMRMGVLLLLLSVPVAAQDRAAEDAGGSAPLAANLAYVEGEVDVEHEGLRERAADVSYVADGDRVITGHGRAEIVFSDGSILHLDRDTTIDVLTPDRLRLVHGRVAFRTSAAASHGYVVDTAAGSIVVGERGEYGIAMSPRDGLRVTVARGAAEVDYAGGSALVRDGEMATFDGPGAHARYARFNTARWDAFDRWSDERINGFSRASSSAYLPHELRPYGSVFDRHGRWDIVADYGRVWYPSHRPGWRPYYNGSWRSTRHGWTWIGFDPWAWPTHHYGRWGLDRGAWFWIPTRVWGPAWVSWAFGPDYVSWSPLGWHGGAVVGLSVSLRSRYDDPWRAWTVMPRRHLGSRGPVRTWAVPGARLPYRDRGAFVTQPSPPRDGVAVPRGATGLPPAGAARRAGDPRDDRRPGGVRYPVAQRSNRSPREPASAPAAVAEQPAVIYAPPEYRRRGGADRAAPSARRDNEPPAGVVVAPPRSVPRPEYSRPEAAPRPAERQRGEGAVRRGPPPQAPSAAPPPAAVPDAGSGRENRGGGAPRGGERRRPPA